MPIQPEMLVAAYEALSRPERPSTVATVAAALAGLVAAQGWGLLSLELEGRGGTGAVRNAALLAGTLSAAEIDRAILANGPLWDCLPHDLGRRALPMLLKEGEAPVGAFEAAGRQFADPSAWGICAYRKTRPDHVIALVALGLHFAPPVAEVAIFQGLSIELLSLVAARRSEIPGVPLAVRERECVVWAARGKTASEIAEILGLSEHTVNHYLTNAATKLHASNRTHAIVKALALGIVDVTDL